MRSFHMFFHRSLHLFTTFAEKLFDHSTTRVYREVVNLISNLRLLNVLLLSSAAVGV